MRPGLFRTAPRGRAAVKKALIPEDERFLRWKIKQ